MSADQIPQQPSEQPQAADFDREPDSTGAVKRRVLVAGSSGLIGTQLCTALETAGWETHRLVRRASQSTTEHRWDPVHGDPGGSSFNDYTAVINLCGAGIGASRWTAKRKKLLRSSRISSTATLAAALASADRPPDTFVSASAVGYYGHYADGNEFSETGDPGTDFLARLTVDWEAAAYPAIAAGIRTVFPRTGMVLSDRGGALDRLLPLFSKGLGGVIGSGRQWVSWISLTDAIRALTWLLDYTELSGPVNLVAPNPVTNREFTEAIAKRLGKPALLPVPAFAVKTALGEMGETLAVKGVKVLPERLSGCGFEFRYPTIAAALAAELALTP